jgi:uncharacterized protein Smg (DUF494 family)
MDQERDRLKHLLIILLEALSVTPGEGGLGASRIQEKVADAGLDEADVNGLLDWIETSLNREAVRDWLPEPQLESPSAGAWRHFGESDRDYITPDGIGFLLELLNHGQISRLQLEALLQYSSYIALHPLDRIDLETVIEQVLFRKNRPHLTGGASEGFESLH